MHTGEDACGHMIYKYLDQKGSSTLLTSVQSAGVAPEVKLGSTQAKKHEGIHLSFKIQGRNHQKSKTGPHKRDFFPPKIVSETFGAPEGDSVCQPISFPENCTKMIEIRARGETCPFPRFATSKFVCRIPIHWANPSFTSGCS